MAEFPEEDMFARVVGEDRRATLEEARLRNERLAAVEAEQSAERKAKADALSRRANESILLHEYRSRGLKPPFANERGMPTVSLSMLLAAGWTIDNSTGTAILLRPLYTPGPPAPYREDHRE